MTKVKFGVYVPTGNIEDAKRAAVQAEQDGFYSLSMNDHFFSPLGDKQMPQLECYTALTALACVTSTVKLVPAITSIAFRNPALLAKIVSTLDNVSNGRFICGLGAGWMDQEYLAHGYAFPPLAERLEQLDETIEVLRAMFTQDVPTFVGKHFAVRDAYNHPRPVQAKLPFMIGGSGTGLLRIAARQADIVNLIPPTTGGKDLVNDLSAAPKFTMETLKSRIAMLHGFMREIGRDPGEIELSGIGFVAMSSDKEDPVMRETAAMIGFSDYATAQGSPVALLGTPAEVRETLRRRTEETKLSFYILMIADAKSQELFANEVMPEFAQ